VLTAILVIFVLGAIGSAAGAGDKKTATNATTKKPTPAPAAEATEEPTPAPTPPPKPKTYTGTGDDVVTIAKPTDGAAILTFKCPRCSENTVVKTNGEDSLLVNTIGTYSGSHLIDSSSGSNTTELTINAVGAWTLTLSGLDQAAQSSGKPISGKGDTVLHITGNTTKAAITITGNENFVVRTFPEEGGSADLAVNTIGSYKGTVPLATPAYVQISSNGAWTVTPE
jgi:hypothetical protein